MGAHARAPPRAAWPAPDESRSSTHTQSRDLDALAGLKLSLLGFQRRGASRRCHDKARGLLDRGEPLLPRFCVHKVRTPWAAILGKLIL